LKFYDFLDKAPSIPNLVIIEGTQKLLSDRAFALLEERLVEPSLRDLNVDRFDAADADVSAPVAAAIAAMPFLSATRLVCVRNTQTLRADPRRKLWSVAQEAPAGNVLVLEDLQSPMKKGKPEPFGVLAGSEALRIDTTASSDVRTRFAREVLSELGASAERRAISAVASAESDLAALRTDLEKLALLEREITLDDLMGETLTNDEIKAYRIASMLVEGKVPQGLALAHELYGSDRGRSAVIPLLSALATEYAAVWELARPGGRLPTRQRWRENALRDVARRLGEQGARRNFERTVLRFEAIVTGATDDARVTIETAAAEALSGRSKRRGRDEPEKGTTA
jgi:DNA polymerase III delta subunit